ncbi:class I SAM-dependent methyltransferase [Undibacterium squillarum]|uniref:class I SAM-dependent methyltransferase n=1 Tax=Undibacterium squillarum TaxID=1131567 RepID=UPI0035AF3C22
MNTLSPTMPSNDDNLSSLDTRAFPTGVATVLKHLARLREGCLTLHFPDGQSATFGQLTEQGLHAVLHLRDWSVIRSVLRSGDIGFAESYIAGHWHSPNPVSLLELVTRNREALEQVIYGSWWGSLLYRIRHLLNRNSRSGSRKNIHAHYDIGNAFYRLWLDTSMTYSSAIFDPAADEDLTTAQDRKYRRILQELQLPADASVLEIGCGWGGFAELAAREAGAKVTGLTLSTEQLAYARKRLAQAGVGEQTDLRLQDYRDTEGAYDGIASIEMFEAVGEEYWQDYFACLKRNLKSGARACIQSIVIDERLFERYRSGTDFIQQYIFPGGMLPSIERFHAMAQQHGLEVCNTFSFGQDYATTLHLWRQQFLQQLPQVRAQGFDDAFIRTWEFYLVYCEAGFRSGNISVAQFTLRKP